MKAKAACETKGDSLVSRVLLCGGETANAMKVSYLLGVGLGAAGRLTGEEGIPLIPPAIDVFYGTGPGSLVGYVAYGAGIATVYADKVYSIVANISDKL